MENILDAAIAATGPRVVSEGHDINRIAVEEDAINAALRGLSGPRGWDASEYGITAEQAAQMLRDADTPENREQVLRQLRRRAIDRAGLDTSNGRVNVLVSGEPAWHRLGINVEAAVDTATAKALAGADWRAEKLQDYYVWDGKAQADPGAFALVRADTGARLNSVGSGYQVIQNDDLFDFFDEVFARFGAKIATAGCLYGGKVVWAQAELKECSFALPGGDENVAYAMFTNKHGDGAAWFFPTSHRTVCANTHRVSLGDKGKGFCVRHTGELASKIGQAQELLGLAALGMEQYREEAVALSHAWLDVDAYAPQVLDAVLGVTDAERRLQALDPLTAALEIDAAEKQLGRLKKTEAQLLDEVLARYETDRCEPKGTAWAALNAVTETFQHGPYKRQRGGSDDERRSRRFESVVSGDVDAAAQVARRQALAAV